MHKILHYKSLKEKALVGYVMALLIISCKETKKEVPQNKEEAYRTIHYKNPLNVKFGDPYILDNGDGVYYLYGTGGAAVNGFSVYSSTNLVNWKYEKQVYFGNTENSWCTSDFWAPECYRYNDKYYLFYSANWRYNPTNEEENFHIGVAVSDSPLGPFEDLKNEPLFEPGYPVIDANVFKDSDGKYYLYYSRVCYKHPVESEISAWAKAKGIYDEIEESWVYGVELSPDFKSIIGEPVLILRPPLKISDENSEWESRSITSREINRRWTEGSYTFKKNGTYYIMYSANYYAGENYAVGYATSKSPLGHFIKSENNPILEKNLDSGGDVTGTGHNSLLFLDGISKIYCVYHGRTNNTGQERVVFIDEMKILEDGSLKILGPTTEPTKLVLPKKKN